MKGKNKGFSLVELIVVIAIMAVAMTASGFLLSNISLANAKNCATEIQSAMEKSRMETTKRVEGSAPKVEISIGADDNVYLELGNGSQEKIGNSSVTVKYSDGGTLKNLKDKSDKKLVFSYKKATGGFDEMPTDKMVITAAGREYTLTCYKTTGKVTME